MKKGTKLGLGAFAFLAGALVLTGCTNSFCSKDDRAHIMYAFDFGVSEYHEASEKQSLIDRGYKVYDVDGNTNIIYMEDRPISKGDTVMQYEGASQK